MEASRWIITVFAIASFLSSTQGSRAVVNLKKNLLGASKYDEYVRMTPPQERADKALNVSFGISLISIQDFDTDSGIGRFHIWEKVSWVDNRLNWNPNAYEGAKAIRIPTDSIWRPDIKLFTSRHVPELVDMTALMHVSSDGTVIWVPPTQRVIKCKNEEGERWSCEFKYGSWTYDGSILNVDFYNDLAEIDMGDFNPPDVPEIKVISSDAERHAKKYDCCPETYVDLTFTLVFDVTGSGRNGAMQSGVSGALFSLIMVVMAILHL